MTLRARPVDALFGVMATAFGAVSLYYPFGRDQGLFYYAGREWLLRGQLLYRDVWDHKPPVIYFVHMVAIALMGEHLWAIRVLELGVAVPLMAWVTARLASPRGTPVASGVLGAAWIGSAVYYFGYLDFWDTAQCEMWSALFATGAIAAALQARNAVRGALGAGVLAALALFTKPPIVFFVLISGGAVVLRALENPSARRVAVARAVAAWAAGGAGAGGLILAYFGLRRGLAPMLDILIGANAVYVVQERTVHDVTEVLDHSQRYFATLQPFSALFVVVAAGTMFTGFSRSDPALTRRYVLPVLLALASYAAVLMQLKFYPYHFGTLVAAAGLFAAMLYSDMVAIARTRKERWLAPAAFLALAIGAYGTSGSPLRTWLTTVSQTVAYVAGKLSREEFSRTFDLPLNYAYHDAERAGLWLRAHASPGDTLVVRGFEPEIYAISGLHFTGRFFWTPFLTAPTRIYRRSELLAEDLAAIQKQPPRFAVTFRALKSGIDSPSWFEGLGYEPRTDIGGFTILERPR